MVFMRVATITEAKNRLSALLDIVKAGETVVIVDRGIPVARLESAVATDDTDGRLARLERQGLVRRRGSGMVPDWILRTAPPVGRGQRSIVDTLLEERREGR